MKKDSGIVLAIKREREFTKSEINEINRTPDKLEDNDKIGLLKQLMLWHKLTQLERATILADDFKSEISKDNYTQKLILKYL